MVEAATANNEAIEAWDGPLYDRFVQFRHLLATGLGVHGDEGLRVLAPRAGERALDVGCGFGDTAQQLAELVGADGSVLGVDASARFIETARREAAQAGVGNARFAVADVEASAFEESFDVAFSRMGTMFFANPVAALRNIRQALVPGGRLAMVVWRSKLENECFYRAQLITERFVTKPDEYDEPTCGPGPFSMANADTTSAIMLSAGFENVALQRCDLPVQVGVDLDEAVQFVMSIGPAGEILRLAGDSAAHVHEPVAAALRAGMAEWVTPQGVYAPASTWIVTARAPLR
ncbi:MAG TPA: class I SAM-dependent methyltransferase [Solirubrobacteraceae bacterium]|jgi:ubiquinone/menaquinone biosynthesis C-methylase UbiE|nr:class I SAM-dependent methyltransferase [Solirubrobacteraceae bacterium]